MLGYLCITHKHVNKINIVTTNRTQLRNRRRKRCLLYILSMFSSSGPALSIARAAESVSFRNCTNKRKYRFPPVHGQRDMQLDVYAKIWFNTVKQKLTTKIN